MDRFLAAFPKAIIATVAIAIGILFIVLSDPPKTVCDAQMEVFRKSQKGFLYLDPQKKAIKTTKLSTLTEHCKLTNNPGGCYELFQEIRHLISDLAAVPTECRSAIASESAVKQALLQQATLMVRLAWGSKPPSSSQQKFSWLDTADISLFCNIKEHMTRLYGEDTWAQFRERMFTELPGSSGLTRQQVWESVILSENCARYP